MRGSLMCILCLGNSSECFATKDRQPSHEPTAGRQGAQRDFPCDLCVADVASLGTFVAKSGGFGLLLSQEGAEGTEEPGGQVRRVDLPARRAMIALLRKLFCGAEWAGECASPRSAAENLSVTYAILAGPARMPVAATSTWSKATFNSPYPIPTVAERSASTS
jgi:hypothetical protein